MDKMVSQLHEMALAEEIISYGEKLPLVSGSWDLSTGFWWNDLKNFMSEKRNITDWRMTFEDESLPKHFSDYLFREEGAHSWLWTMRYCAAFCLGFAMLWLWGEGEGSVRAESHLA